MQLLQLFQTLLDSVRRYWRVSVSNTTSNTTNNNIIIPMAAVFDAIAPYYPIQFNPPKHNNNPHGITKRGLRHAWQNVVRAGVQYDHTDNNDSLLVDDSMLSLSLAIVLEQLMPLPEDEPTTMLEKYEALEDLQGLFLLVPLPSSSSSSSSLSQQSQHVLEKLEAVAWQQVSQALWTVHQEAAALAVTSKTTSSSSGSELTAKQTADLCRQVVAKLVRAVEQLPQQQQSVAWKALVVEAVQRLTNEEETNSGSRQRLNIAYVANLCGCGGVKTLNYCLQYGLVPLIQEIQLYQQQQDSMSLTRRSNDSVALAVSGVAAFFAATNTSMRIASETGVVISPHPLEQYGAVVADSLLNILASVMTATKVEHGGEHEHEHGGDQKDGVSWALATAAVRALESVVWATPQSCWEEIQLERIGHILMSSIVTPLLVSNKGRRDHGADEDMHKGTCGDGCNHGDMAYDDWLLAGAQTIGSMLGRINDGHSLLDTDDFDWLVQEKILPAIVASAKTLIQDTRITRYDWMVLAVATRSQNEDAVARVVGKMTDALRDCIQSNRMEEAIVCAQVLNRMFEYGGKDTIKVFHQLQSPQTTALDLVEVLLSTGQTLGESGEMFSFGTSLLRLPPTEQDKAKLGSMQEGCLSLVSLLRPAWIGASVQSIEKLISKASIALPPLTETDLVCLTVIFPLLSGALSEESITVLELVNGDTLKGLVPDLADFVLRPENHPGTRSYAAMCMQLIISNYMPEPTQDCPVRMLIKDFLMPTLRDVLKDSAKNTQALDEWLMALAVLCTSAACRGGASSKTADLLIAFLVDLACIGEAQFALGDDESVVVNLEPFDHEPAPLGKPKNTSLIVASHFGSVFSSKGGSELWKQRLTHLAGKRIQYNWEAGLGQALPSPGTVATMCYMICASNPKTLSTSTLELATKIVAQSLSADAQSDEATGYNLISVKKLVLSALLKLIAISPNTISPIAPYLTTGIIRAYVSGEAATPTEGIAFKLLALQALESLIRLDKGQDLLAKTKPAVVSILTAAMNHPSSILRHAAVQVRNVWCLD
jgi:hypothetical protein